MTLVYAAAIAVLFGSGAYLMLKSDLLRVAGIAQEHTVFWGAAGCAVVAAVLALVLFRGVRADRVSTREVLSTH